MVEPTENRISRLLGDRYELIELIGKGGFASVYRVRNLRLQRTEALKVLSEALTEDPDFAKRFEQEARVAADLDHPNIVKIYDYGAIEGFFWFSMQFIGGPSVARELRSRGHYEDLAAARIAIGVLDALAYSHARGVIHRDIKPDNILLDRAGRPYLTDFGVAKSQMALVKTHAGTLLGSPAYMSPEQLQGRPLDGRSDIYSVGVTLYKMLSGALPFSGEDTFRATMKRLTENPEPLRSKRPEINPLLAEIVMRSLQRDPALRFPDAASMREELESFVMDVTPPRMRISSATQRLEETMPSRPIPVQAPPTTEGGEDTIPSGPIASPPPAAPQAPAPVQTEALATSSPPRLDVSPAPAPASAPRLRYWGWFALAIAIAAFTAVLTVVHRAQPTRQKAAVLPTPLVKQGRVIPTAAASSLPVLLPTAVPTQEPIPASTAQPTKRLSRPVPRTPRRAAPSPVRPSPPPPSPRPTEIPSPAPHPGRRTPPEIIERVPLIFPPGAIAAHHNESVGMLIIVGADGKLKSARIISSVCPECDRVALEAVKRFRFRPARDAKGNPVEGSFGLAIRIP